ncbi:MAG: hypothetical protein NW226_17855 [Microscillaceae bacterium]|nr:hypothetical protein [Microscillaceae bacterium]
MKKILCIVFFAFFMVGVGSSFAQQSMYEIDKLRKKEEKNRKKVNRKNDKTRSSQNTSPSEEMLFQMNKKQQKNARSSKYRKKNIPKASNRLSQENKRTTSTRAQSRKGSDGLTKAAKGQLRTDKRRKRALK